MERENGNISTEQEGRPSTQWLPSYTPETLPPLILPAHLRSSPCKLHCEQYKADRSNLSRKKEKEREKESVCVCVREKERRGSIIYTCALSPKHTVKTPSLHINNPSTQRTCGSIQFHVQIDTSASVSSSSGTSVMHSNVSLYHSAVSRWKTRGIEDNAPTTARLTPTWYGTVVHMRSVKDPTEEGRREGERSATWDTTAV